MKNSTFTHAFALAGVTALSLTVSSIASAQTSQTPDASAPTDSKVDNSTAGNSATTGAPATTSDTSNSKDLNGALDKNPGTTSTDSAPTSATKTPSDASTPADKSTTTASTHEHHSDRMSDKEFLCKAAQGGMTEVELGKLAQDKASSSDVKQFGSRMVEDHSKADDQLMAVASKTGVTVPSTLDAKHQAMVTHMQSLSGPAFDKAYVNMMVRDHEKDAAEFRKESTSAQSPDVQAFAGDTLKVIEMHLSDIKSIQNSQK